MRWDLTRLERLKRAVNSRTQTVMALKSKTIGSQLGSRISMSSLSARCVKVSLEMLTRSTSACARSVKHAFTSTLWRIRSARNAQSVETQRLWAVNHWRTWFATRPFRKLLTLSTLSSKNKTSRRSIRCTRHSLMLVNLCWKTLSWSSMDSITKPWLPSKLRRMEMQPPLLTTQTQKWRSNELRLINSD